MNNEKWISSHKCKKYMYEEWTANEPGSDNFVCDMCN